jgi:hypothetical protein
MIQSHRGTTLSDLYLVDETAWLEQMARLSANGDPSEMDLDHLSEYLTDMAKRDKREVVSRLVVLLVHLLKWEHQQDKRSRGWELTIKEQREELADLVESAVLRQHLQEEFGAAYRKAVRRAAVEMEVEEKSLPQECPWTFQQILGD